MKRIYKSLSRIKYSRMILALLHDVVLVVLAWGIAFNIRFNVSIPAPFVHSLQQVLLWAVPLQVFIFYQFGIYRNVWRFTGANEIKSLILAVLTATLMIGMTLLVIQPSAVVPRSVVLATPLILILLLLGSRFVYKLWRDHKSYGKNRRRGKPVLLLGSGDHLGAIVTDIDKSPEWQVVGVLHDKKKLHGLLLQGVPIFGSISQLEEYSQAYGISDVIVAMPAKASAKKKRAIALADSLALNVMTLPAFDDIINGKINVKQIRRVEVEDLLGRDEVKLDDAGLHALLDQKVVMVTGAGGSIGTELCKQILKYQPAVLICYELSEFALYQVEQSLLQNPMTKKIFLVGDVKNTQRIDYVLTQYKPQVVFHAAAYKHVPMMESNNVSEALTNNVVGTYTLAKACQAHAIDKFILISTDKAVNPTNVMGASKRLAEKVCQSLHASNNPNHKTEFIVVRFGNVLGSSGSVIPKFREQIANGGPVTITDPNITRYFMSIAEACQLVMQAGVMGKGGEIFVLDMGQPVKIIDLAKDMIRLSGFHHEEIKIKCIGLRPGEKLYEELLADNETTLPTQHKKLRIAQSAVVAEQWLGQLLHWLKVVNNYSETKIKSELAFWVEEYIQSTDHPIDQAILKHVKENETLH